MAAEKMVQSCQYCRNLKPIGYDDIIDHPYEDFVKGISQKSCRLCDILHEAIRQFIPSFFTDEGSLGPRPGTNVDLNIDKNGIVHVGVSKNGTGTLEGQVQLYHTEDMKLSIELSEPLREIATTAGDPPMWEFLRSCLDDCVKQHPGCTQQQAEAWYPKRLLLLEESETQSCSARLIETQQELPGSPYIALSHCWGGKSHLCALKANIDKLMKHVGLDMLPSTFQDCITTARELGVKYVYIDSLCIVQDDRADWAIQSQSMGEVYKNALLTVGAVTSPNSSVPFLGPNAPSLRKDCQAIIIPSGDPVMRIKAREYGTIRWGACSRAAEPLYSRAWAWQEELLSRRSISFLQQKVTWACKAIVQCESGTSVRPSPSKLAPAADDSQTKIMEDWFTLISEYCDRHLTFWTDRLPALSGVASEFQHRRDSVYLAGLWAIDFPYCLAWLRRDPHDVPSSKVAIQPSLDNKVPSWSWASVKDRIGWADYEDDNVDRSVEGLRECTNEAKLSNIVELLHIHCPPSTKNLFGEVEHGSYLDLSGKVVEAEFFFNSYGCGHVQRPGLKPQLAIPDCQIVVDYETGNHKHTGSENVVGSRNSACRLRRATHRGESLPSEEARASGPVLCLLLFSAQFEGRTPACVMIVSPHPDFEGMYQRLGIGHGDLGPGSPLYAIRKTWAQWEWQEDLEEWENWEEWFAGAETRILRIA